METPSTFCFDDHPVSKFLKGLEMWAIAQRDGRPGVAPFVQRRKVWLTPTTTVPCSNAARMRNPLKFVGVPYTRQQISAVSKPKFTIL